MIGIRVLMELLWGYSVRIAPQGKGRTAYRLPPPTTFLGAYIAGIQQVLGDTREVIIEGHGKKASYYSAAELYKDIFDDVFIKVEDFNGKIYGEPIKQVYIYRGSVRDNVITMPGVFHQSGLFNVIYIIKDDAMSSIGLSKEDLERGAWAITRLGTKEGIIIVKDVNIVQLTEDIAREGVTQHSFYLQEGIELPPMASYWAERVIHWKSRGFRFGDYSEAKKEIIIYPREPLMFLSDTEVEVFRLETSDEVLIRTLRGD